MKMILKKRKGTGKERPVSRFLSIVLTMGLMCGVLLWVTPAARAASWMDPYLDKVVAWGVMRGDINGNLNADNNITRAEFVTMVNRAYGYTELGATPFTDIAPRDWFYEDIGIAYNTGYFSGTSGTTASPRDYLTREQAAVIIGRNMMLEEGTGEALGFNDSREFSDWSRHMIQAVAEEGVINGNPDGSFAPKRYVTRGEVAAMLVRAIGTPIQQSGEHSLGGVYGNVTITSPGVTLKDTTIVGDLYITGGLGLGDVVLENVTVLGKIVVSGSGESEKGEHSVILRNTRAEELIVDSMADQFVTLRSEGLTGIDTTKVKTQAYLEDLTDDGLGLLNINLNGESGTEFYLAGNIKDVVNLTEGSTLYMAQGIAKMVTVDEAALNSTLDIDGDAVISTVNLDTAATVNGGGDIGHLNVNAAGCTVTMLPDTVTVRPGITSYVGGENMDSVAAAESSEDPRLLSGYPAARNVAPTTADIIFQTNKRGTIYWALTALADGTVEEEELLMPSAYSGNIIKSGTISATASKTDFTTKLTGLTKDGSYYVSALLVDNRGMRSPVKIAAFTTPDDTVPAFTTGYPTTLIADGTDDEQIVQVQAMTNKSCLMYYALMPKGATAPTAADFKANSLAGNLGHGVVEMTKNTPQMVSRVNTSYLQEVTEYDLYLWLTDADGAKSSAVKKLTVKTLDRTEPRITSLTTTDVKATSVTLSYTLDEPGNFYWAVVKSGANFYTVNTTDYYKTEAAMIQIASGINALKYSTTPSRAREGGTKVTVNITGLEAQTAYDVYFMAQDDAGNYCVYSDALKPPYVIHTLDTEKPTVRQEFTHDGTEGSNITPYPDTSIRLVFSENVQGVLDLDEDGYPDKDEFLDLYRKARDSSDTTYTMDNLAKTLSKYIKLYQKGSTEPVAERTSENAEEEAVINGGWVIDYRKVKIEMDNSGTGELIITFPYSSTDPSQSALNLAGGVTYYFVIEGIADVSIAVNAMTKTTLPEFTTIAAQIMLDETSTRVPEEHDGVVEDGITEGERWYFDMIFSAKPVANDAMDDSVLWDLIMWSDTSVGFKVYEYSDVEKEGEFTWKPLGNGVTVSIPTSDGMTQGASLATILRGGSFEQVNKLRDRIYAIEFVNIGGDTGEGARDKWNIPVTLEITAVSGGETALMRAGQSLDHGAGYDAVVENNALVSDISVPIDFYITNTFVDKTAPLFTYNTPMLTAGDSSVKLRVALDRANSQAFYVVAPFADIPPTGGTDGKEIAWDDLPEKGTDPDCIVTSPNRDQVVNYRTTTNIKAGSILCDGASISEQTVTDLVPNTEYVVYFVLKGEALSSYSQVYCYRFETGDVETPTIYLRDDSPSVIYQTSTDSVMYWMLVTSTAMNTWNSFIDDFYSGVGVNANNKEDIATFDGYNGTDTGGTKDGKVDDEEVQAYFKNHWDDHFTAFDTTTSTYTTPTVLDALMTNIDTSSYMSVFDYYAGANLYQTISDYVTQTTGGTNRAGYGSMETTTAQDSIPLEDYMPNYLTNHYFVAVARNVLGATYGFKAISSIHNVDNTPPRLSDEPIITVIPYTSTGTQCGANDTISYWKGRITLSFTKTPYQLKEGSDKAVSLPTTTGELIKLITVSDISDKAKYDATWTGETITIDFETSSNYIALTLFNSGYISNADGVANSKLILKVTMPQLYNGTATMTNSWSST